MRIHFYIRICNVFIIFFRGWEGDVAQLNRLDLCGSQQNKRTKSPLSVLVVREGCSTKFFGYIVVRNKINDQNKGHIKKVPKEGRVET